MIDVLTYLELSVYDLDYVKFVQAYDFSETKKLIGSALLEDNGHGLGVDVVCILTIIYRKNY